MNREEAIHALREFVYLKDFTAADLRKDESWIVFYSVFSNEVGLYFFKNSMNIRVWHPTPLVDDPQYTITDFSYKRKGIEEAKKLLRSERMRYNLIELNA